MPSTMTKAQFFSHLQRERTSWEALLGQATSPQMTIAGAVGLWSLKDLIVHVMSYEQYIADRIAEILRGETYTPCTTPQTLAAFLERYGYPDFGSPLLDDDEPNAWVVQKYQTLSLAEAVAGEQQIYAQLVQNLAALSEEEIAQSDLLARVASNTFEHYHEHADDIRQWLKKEKNDAANNLDATDNAP